MLRSDLYQSRGGVHRIRMLSNFQHRRVVDRVTENHIGGNNPGPDQRFGLALIGGYVDESARDDARR
jgi:hypothetical protein